MNIQPEEIGPEVPEADALEQSKPLLVQANQESMVVDRLPEDVPRADFIGQRTDVEPGVPGHEGIVAAEAEAAEADIIDQVTGVRLWQFEWRPVLQFEWSPLHGSPVD